MSRRLCALVILAAVPLPLVSGCGDDGGGTNPPQVVPGGPGPGGGPPSNPVIKEAMGKLGRGPASLTPTLGKELKETPPPWDAIGPQASEYAKLTASLVSETPMRGDKESWTKLAKEYADSAAELDKAAQAKDLGAAVTAHGALARSCNECHRTHRGMGPGGPGGPPPGGGRSGPPGSGPPLGGGPPPGGGAPPK